MRNALRARLASGRACLNGWLSIPSGLSAEVMARSGWHSITVDLQHGVQDYMSMVECFQALGAYPVTPMVRVPWNEPGIIGKALDAGAWGLICPMINTAEEARALVDACLYPPQGSRSNGPVRAGGYGEPGLVYQSFANDELLILPMIETRRGVENLEEILDVPGVSGVYVGPSDMGLSFGLSPTLDREEDEIINIYKRIINGCEDRGKICGLHNGTPAYAARMINLGFRIVTITSDATLLGAIARDTVRQIRSEAHGLAD
ncbi:HpcH/HpaI aldolase family protein [Agrobacterium larrymoorei]|uniref:Aldolase/citrate lyase family protein n=1 Tax=Agrobacterium larrymoorei TaxID=160699 RepID=A0AAF0HFH7_9HYPH|nr:aldolase/citrate lyase family protein [Agrobacterium larrymoorei]WHA43895.1 aldolase/citrate lyase family protein [Agrobacterium larrymoorei]